MSYTLEMKFSRRIIIAAVMGVVGLPLAHAQPRSDDPALELKWSLAHGPRVYSEYTARSFWEAVQDKLGDKITVAIDPQSVNPRGYRHGVQSAIVPEVYLLKSGKVQVAQLYLGEFEDPDGLLQVFGLPFLFRDHEHVTKVIEGPIGKKLLESLRSQGLIGLAFSYSGGYECFLSAKKLSFEDPRAFEGLSAGNMVPFQTKALGMKNPREVLTQVQLSEDAANYYVGKGLLDLSLETYSDLDYFYKDFNGPRKVYFYGADYNVLFTAIVMKESFINSLPPKNQSAIREGVKTAARAERELIIADSKKFKGQLLSGALSNPFIEYAPLDEGGIGGLRKASAKVYDSLSPAQRALVEEIRNTK
jgi:TRAP-type C4-dicarboxylate transport system substrate-binding protein